MDPHICKTSGSNNEITECGLLLGIYKRQSNFQQHTNALVEASKCIWGVP